VLDQASLELQKPDAGRVEMLVEQYLQVRISPASVEGNLLGGGCISEPQVLCAERAIQSVRMERDQSEGTPKAAAWAWAQALLLLLGRKPPHRLGLLRSL
jgi:hypothetical protein